ncbi:phosphodiester glycosidase family protein [Streptomyces gardneri]|uniref:phosphodiester glycosidase family protein n=1 Tax=Streptomyces gardneri TaxID=66892 RepID=UPI0037D42E75
MTAARRPWPALAAAFAATLALTSSAVASPAVAEPPRTFTDSWAKGAPVTIAPGVTHTTWTETPTAAEAKVRSARLLQIVEIDPSTAPVTLESAFGTADGLPELVETQLKGTAYTTRHPHAGVNGGLFRAEDPNGNATHTGVAVTDGVLHSSSCWGGGEGTSGAVIQYGVPYITKLLTKLTLTTARGETVTLDDINRNPGRARGCQRDAEDLKISGSLFSDTDEIVLFTNDYGAPLPQPGTDTYKLPAGKDDTGYEVVIDATGTVVDAHEGRGRVTVTDPPTFPAGHRVLQGIGSGADWLRTHLALDDRVSVDQKLTDTTLKRDIRLDASVDVVGSFHQLLRNGAALAGAPHSCNGQVPGKDGTTIICTDSRTALGTTTEGRSVLVTLTGDGIEDGDYVDTFAQLLDAEELGLVDVLNLDGGGSTTLVTHTGGTSTVRTPPTDTGPSGLVHRKVADTVYTGHGGYGLTAR